MPTLFKNAEAYTLQEFPRKFRDMIAEAGWSLKARYRAVKTGTSQYSEVQLFESLGTDGSIRQFGMINGYDLSKPTFDDSRYIAESSRLAIVGVGDGAKKTFQLPGGPMQSGTEKTYVNGVEVAKSTYTFGTYKDEITFTAAPPAGQTIKMAGYLSTAALEPTNVFGIFTYNDVYFDRGVTKGAGDGTLGTANGTKTAFQFPKFPVRPGTVKIYLAGVEQSDTLYTIDYATGAVTFTTAPAAGTLEADYKYILSPIRGVDYGDIQVTSSETDMLTAKAFGGLAYAAFTFIQPSIPTVMTMTNDTNLSRSFNRDSFIYLWGSINKDRLSLMIRVDPSAEPDKAYYMPLYFGRLHVAGDLPRRNTVLIGGAKTGAPVSWVKDLKIGNILVDYGPETSNGNDTVLLHQSIGGSLNQKHYLAFITHDKAIDAADTKFNPSAYTDKYHISQIWVVHPQEGYVGKLDDMYAIHPKNIEQGDELEIEKTVPHEWIGRGDGVRKVFHIEHQSVEAQPLVFKDCVEVTTGITYDPEHKSITFATAPADGVDLTASYQFKQLFKYFLATAPRTATRLDEVTPFNPIGFGIFKENVE
ncbi:DUF2460 domain-containing protein [Staphylococcus aureus]|uniref:DUF2460 domain-containing protein n=1 Tax=Staphylococcus aureus TaxID=1280 RepID=UPI0020C0E40B|nr:DUF2460 domain-containing protein [Staphylococcus aureus]